MNLGLLVAGMLVAAQAVMQRTHAPLHPPQRAKPFMVLRLGHSGSSWLTSMLSSQNNTYVCREAIYPMFNPVEVAKVASMSSDDITSYLLQTLERPSGNILHPNEVQIYDYGTENGVTSCLRERGQNCHVAHLGVTLDPVGSGLDVHGQDVLPRVSAAHPNLPVLVFRRSNVVKHALAKGGTSASDPSRPLARHMRVENFLKRVRHSVEKDKLLTEARNYFRNTKVVTYEELERSPIETMNSIYEFLGMPRTMTEAAANSGEKKTPENLRQLISNFDELADALEEQSPCLLDQLLAEDARAFGECPNF